MQGFTPHSLRKISRKNPDIYYYMYIYMYILVSILSGCLENVVAIPEVVAVVNHTNLDR